MTTPEPAAPTSDSPPAPSETPAGSGASPPTEPPYDHAAAEAAAIAEIAGLLELDQLRDQVLALEVRVEQLTRALEMAPSTATYLKAVRAR